MRGIRIQESDYLIIDHDELPPSYMQQIAANEKKIFGGNALQYHDLPNFGNKFASPAWILEIDAGKNVINHASICAQAGVISVNRFCHEGPNQALIENFDKSRLFTDKQNLGGKDQAIRFSLARLLMACVMISQFNLFVIYIDELDISLRWAAGEMGLMEVSFCDIKLSCDEHFSIARPVDGSEGKAYLHSCYLQQ
jgi:hypothetical protein